MDSKTILLVEDNEMNRDMLSRRLRRKGYEVKIAVNGAEGCSMARSERPALILMDLSLPIMDGWDATRRIKSDQQTSSIPIIALTAHAMVGDLEKALDAGADDYDTKPVELNRLLGKMEALLAKFPSVESVTPKEQAIPIVEIHQNMSPVQPSSNDSANYKILIVDDNDLNRDMLSRRLKRANYEVLLAESGEEALKILQQETVDLVLLDIMMPGLSGTDTLKRIRQNYSQAQLPVLMATAKDASEDMVKAFELGANDYITKPIDFPVALARIQSHLKTMKAVSQESLPQESLALKQQERSVNAPTAYQKNDKPASNLDILQPDKKMFTLTKPIRLLYAPMDSNLWKTGNLVTISPTQAEIHANKQISISGQSEVRIRLWNKTALKIDKDINALVLGISSENSENLIVEFTSQSPLIERLIDQYTSHSQLRDN